MFNKTHFIVGAISFLTIGTVSASPTQEVMRLLTRSEPAKVVFSDGSTRWESNTTTVSRLIKSKAIIVHSKHLALDTDGASNDIRACDSSAQRDTSLTDHKGRPTDANSIPYFVLPWCGNAKDMRKCKATPPYAQLGLQKGDLAAVIANEKIAFALAADLGPEKKFGEGSVELHRQLGHETVGMDDKNPRCAANVSLPSEVYFVIFPKSNNKWLSGEEIRVKTLKLWDALLGE